jgi:hypothetical protein
MSATADLVQLSAFQRRVLEVPEDLNLLLAGGRGGGKSWSIALMILRYCVQYGSKARVLYLRPTNPGLEDFANITRDVFGKAFGAAARFNQTTGKWTLPTNSTVELGHLEAHAAGYATYATTYQGRSFGMICVDEYGAYPNDAVLNLVRSNIRADAGVPKRIVLSSNPGGPGHAHIYRKYITRALPWVPFEDEHGEAWCVAPSTLTDNEFIDQADYARKLASATSGDAELYRAWVSGDWNIARGAFFSGCLDEKRSLIPAWPHDALRGMNSESPSGVVGRHGVRLAPPLGIDPWRFYLSMDFGSAAPCVVYLCAMSPGANGPDGRFYSRGSVLLIDEYTTALRDDPARGNGFTVPQIADRIKDMCRDWRVPPRGVADDAIWNTTGSGQNIGHSHNLGDEFADCGVYLRPARKGSRLSGWSLMRTMLSDAGAIDKPGLYISERCKYFWETVPTLPRSLRNVEDLDTGACDHAADACRYGLGVVFNSRPVQDIKIG